MKTIYMDNSATTPVLPEVFNAMKPYFCKRFGNPSSLHFLGVEADNAVEKARETIAKCINAEAKEIIFTGCATEANNLAEFGVAYAYKDSGKNHLITSKVEHSATKNPFSQLKEEGFKVTFLDVDKEGFIDLNQLKKELNSKTSLVSVIHANHEIGTIQDLPAISKLCREAGALLHIDACQSFTKVPIDVKKIGVDLMTINAHKIYGPKGVGALYVREGVKLRKLFYGGPQEKNIRSGTENVPGIVGFAKAAEIGVKNLKKNVAKTTKLRNELIKELLKIPDSFLNGPKEKNLSKRLCNNVDITFKFVEGEAMLLRLSMEGICVSTGSACSSKSLQPSHILTAIGLKHTEAHGSLRFSLSPFNSLQEVKTVAEKTKEVVEDLRRITAYKG